MTKIYIFSVIVMMTLLSSCFFDLPCIEGNGIIIQEYRDASSFSSVHNETSFDVYVTQSDAFSVMVSGSENLLPYIETERTAGTLYIHTKKSNCFSSSENIEIYISMPEIEELSLSGSGLIYSEQIVGEELEITASSSGEILIDSIFCSDLFLIESGSGNISLSLVDADFLSAKLSSSGEIDFGEAYIAEAGILVSGSGLVIGDIFGALLTEIRLSSSGKVRLYGDTGDLVTTHSGSGRIDVLDLVANDVTSRLSGSGNVYVNVLNSLDVSITGSGSLYFLGDPDEITSVVTGSGRIKSYN